MNAIEANNALAKYSGKNNFHLTFDLKVKEGDFCLFVGSNGSGKTTLFDIIIGYKKLNKGELINNKQKEIAYCVQDFNGGLFPWFSVIENILLPAKATNLFNNNLREEALYLLKLFKLDSRADDYPYALSGGQKQIVNIIRTICTPCEIMLFDEPFSALHSDSRTLAKRIIQELSHKKTILLISHSNEDIDMNFNRFFVYQNNQIQETDKDTIKTIIK
ncbi:ATP-binding cassette domain-containing protein [Porphyromonas gingivalis]|uniref:ATP-binding cassette domain-containing protein n=1 Tax=Porphyromonas gingivalis TaxID=837 RepID=UPI00247FEBB5|nr:ATP-binding cassette domain-containing protein [Porphyromonas gingivalis]MDH7904160.1 ATP-binding cassette domain-containing protein [Porphyromonas gingivalis]